MTSGRTFVAVAKGDADEPHRRHPSRARHSDATGPRDASRALSGSGRQKGLCAACGEPLEPGYHLDHRIPLALGGVDDESNMDALHFACHAKKTARDLSDIAKAKRRAFKAAGLKKPGAGRLQGRGFAKFEYPEIPEDAA